MRYHHLKTILLICLLSVSCYCSKSEDSSRKGRFWGLWRGYAPSNYAAHYHPGSEVQGRFPFPPFPFSNLFSLFANNLVTTTTTTTTAAPTTSTATTATTTTTSRPRVIGVQTCGAAATACPVGMSVMAIRTAAERDALMLSGLSVFAGAGTGVINTPPSAGLSFSWPIVNGVTDTISTTDMDTRWRRGTGSGENPSPLPQRDCLIWEPEGLRNVLSTHGVLAVVCV